MPLAEALLRHTHLYIAFRLGRSFDPAAPRWVEFLDGLAEGQDPGAWAFETYLSLTSGLPPGFGEPPRPDEHAHGAFSYALWEGGRVRLHFGGAVPGPDGEYPRLLSRALIPQRLAELRELVADVRERVPGARTFVGGSWLYNIEAYRRLFPPQYLATAHLEEPETQFIALWGQFLDHRRQVRPEIAARFEAAMARASDLNGLLQAFPYPVLRLESPVEGFYEHFL